MTQTPPPLKPPPLTPPSSARADTNYKLPRTYVAVWGVLGALAVGYLGLALGAPQSIGLPAHDAGRLSASTASGEDADALRHLQERLSRAQLEIAKLRTTSQSCERMAESGAAPAATGSADRVAKTSEQDARAADGSTPLVTAAAEQVAVVIKNGSDDSAAAVAAAAVPSAEAAEAANEAVIAQTPLRTGTIADGAPQGAAIETGSVQVPPPPTRAPAPPLAPVSVAQAPVVGDVFDGAIDAARAAGSRVAGAANDGTAGAQQVAGRSSGPQMGVRLASGPSVDSLRLAWSLMIDRAGSAMDGLEPYVVPAKDVGALGPTYDLIAGPLNTLSDAQRICNVAAVQRSVCEIRQLSDTEDTL